MRNVDTTALSWLRKHSVMKWGKVFNIWNALQVVTEGQLMTLILTCF